MEHFPSPALRLSIRALVFATLLVASAARADRQQVYSITGVDCVECANPIKTQLKKVKGVKKVDFDIHKVEITVAMDDHVHDDAVLAAIARSGPNFKGTVGAGKGAYIPFGTYPKDADVVVLTESGAAVGPLEKLRAPGKYTVFDFYADWCGPCRDVDAQLRGIVQHRPDIAVRKLDVVDFDSALAHEQGSKMTGLWSSSRRLENAPSSSAAIPNGCPPHLASTDAKVARRRVGSRGSGTLTRHGLDLTGLIEPQPAGRRVRDDRARLRNVDLRPHADRDLPPRPAYRA